MSRVVRFKPFEADLATGELRKDGVHIPLQPQPFAVLAALVERPGRLVTRVELRDRLWPGDVFVDFEHALNKAVSKLREALGDDGERPQFVETLPRRGYRFVASIGAGSGGAAVVGARLLYQGRTVALPPGSHVIGRDETLAVRVDSKSVSRRHARLVIGERSATIEDLGSKNGTHVNDRPIQAPTPLADGDRIAIGAITLTFRSEATDSTETIAHASRP